jgi:hypothetical protein
VFGWPSQRQLKDIPHEYHQTLDKGHGCPEIRRHYLLDSVEHLIDAERWRELKRIDMIEPEWHVNGKDFFSPFL